MEAAYAIQKGLASMTRIDKIPMAQSDINDPEQPKPAKFTHAIEYRNVWFRYRNDWVLKGINLTIPKGKTVALVGQSGSGKSTLVDLLPRFYDVTEGSIAIDDTDIRQVKLVDLRGLMGNVNQEGFCFNDTFFNNIAFGVEVPHGSKWKKQPKSPMPTILSWLRSMDTIPILATVEENYPVGKGSVLA